MAIVSIFFYQENDPFSIKNYKYYFLEQYFHLFKKIMSPTITYLCKIFLKASVHLGWEISKNPLAFSHQATYI